MPVVSTHVTGRVVGTKHTGTTPMGNPRFDVTIELLNIDGTPVLSSSAVTFKLADNTGLAYGIENPEYRREAHVFGLNRAGRITQATLAELDARFMDVAVAQ